LSDTAPRRGEIGRRINEWHAWLRGSQAEGKERKANAAALAEIRRCATPGEVMLTWPFGRLLRMAFPQVATAGVEAVQGKDIEALARTALVMSRASRSGAEPPTQGRVPRLMAQIPEGGRAPAVGRVRANILLASPDEDEACRTLLSLLPLLGGGEPVLDAGHVLRAMRRWDEAKTDWAMEYYAALPPDEKADAA